MEAYKRWIRRNKKGVQEDVRVLLFLAKGFTWLLPERFYETEIGPEAVRSTVDIMNVVNKHIIETTPSKVHTRPPESSSFPYSLCLTYTETLVEVVAQHYFGDDKWNFIAVMEATKVLARLALLQNSGYKMLLHGRETMNDRKDSKDANQQLVRGHFLQQGQNGTIVKRPTLLSFLSEKGLHGGLFLMGEFMFIARPLVYVLLIRKYGIRSWLPWLVSLSIDHIAMSSSKMSLTNHKDRGLSLSDPEKDELRRRKWLLALYLLRDPCFGKYIWRRHKSTNNTVKHVPIFRSFAGKLVRRLVGVHTRYTYISGS